VKIQIRVNEPAQLPWPPCLLEIKRSKTKGKGQGGLKEISWLCSITAVALLVNNVKLEAWREILSWKLRRSSTSLPGWKDESKRREIKLGYCAKVNGRSTIIGLEYVAVGIILRSLWWIKSLFSYRFKRWGTYVDKSTISISIKCSRPFPINNIVSVWKSKGYQRKGNKNIKDTLELRRKLAVPTKRNN
jgi:hypothetical protein